MAQARRPSCDQQLATQATYVDTMLFPLQEALSLKGREGKLTFIEVLLCTVPEAFTYWMSFSLSVSLGCMIASTVYR